MRTLWTWLRVLLALVLGVVAIELFHRLGARLLPELYAAMPTSSAGRIKMLCMTFGAGVAGSFVCAVVARHKPWLALGAFLLVMLVIDVVAVRGMLAAEPLWSKAIMLASLPFQVFAGGFLARALMPAPRMIRANV